MRNEKSPATPKRETLYTCQELADLMETPMSNTQARAVPDVGVVRFDPLTPSESGAR